MQKEKPAVGAHGYEPIDEEAPAIYIVVKGYGRGLRVFKVPPRGDVRGR